MSEALNAALAAGAIIAALASDPPPPAATPVARYPGDMCTFIERRGPEWEFVIGFRCPRQEVDL